MSEIEHRSIGYRSAGGASIGVPLGIIIVWLIDKSAFGPVPPEVAASIGSVISGILGFLGVVILRVKK